MERFGIDSYDRRFPREEYRGVGRRDQGQRFLTPLEVEGRLQQERQRAEQEHQRAERAITELEQERQRAQRLEQLLREAGIAPDRER